MEGLRAQIGDIFLELSSVEKRATDLRLSTGEPNL